MEVPPSEIEYEATHISEDDSATVITAVATCFFFAFVAVALRLISRRLKHLSLQHDDYAAIIALLLTAGLCANIGADLYAGLGKHAILSDHPTIFAKAIIATRLLHITALIPTKLSIVFFYRRLSASATFSIALWFLGIWVVLIGIAGNVLVVIDCANASILGTGAHCVDGRTANLSYGGPDVLTNLLLICWPIQFLWSMEVDRIRSAHLVGVFALGGFACAASIVRLVYLNNASPIDSTWSATASTIWSFVELTIGLTASCLATLTPLMALILPRYSSSFPSTARRTRSFISDTETAIATPQPHKQPSSRQRARTISFKDSPTAITSPLPPPSSSSSSSKPTISKSWRKSTKSRKTGADSPGFTWRCSGRPSDLEKWKSLPPPPVPSPPRPQPSPPASLLLPAAELPEAAHLSMESAVAAEAEEAQEEKDEEEEKGKEKGQSTLGPTPMFRPVIYGEARG